jgi:hypothetical protein
MDGRRVRLLGNDDGEWGRCGIRLLAAQGKHRGANSEGGDGIRVFEAETFFQHVSALKPVHGIPNAMKHVVGKVI